MVLSSINIIKGCKRSDIAYARSDLFFEKMKIKVIELKQTEKYEIELPGNNEYIYGVETAAPIFCKMIGDNNVEYVGLLCLDSTNRIINYSTVSIGSIDSVNASVSQILKIALISNAFHIIVAHNHPSGVLEVTSNDIEMTKKIGVLAGYFDIKLIDSLVVNGMEAVSIREKTGVNNG